MISSLALLAKVNRHGFIEAPYRKVNVKNGSAFTTNKIEYLSADDEDRVMIAQSDEETDKNKMLTNDHIRARIKGRLSYCHP